MITRRPATHMLRIDVPLAVDATAPDSVEVHAALSEALAAILPMVRLGTRNLLCDGPTVELVQLQTPHTTEDTPSEQPQPHTPAH